MKSKPTFPHTHTHTHKEIDKRKTNGKNGKLTAFVLLSANKRNKSYYFHVKWDLLSLEHQTKRFSLESSGKLVVCIQYADRLLFKESFCSWIHAQNHNIHHIRYGLTRQRYHESVNSFSRKLDFVRVCSFQFFVLHFTKRHTVALSFPMHGNGSSIALHSQ